MRGGICFGTKYNKHCVSVISNEREISHMLF